MNSFENAVNATYLIVRCGKQRYGIPLKNVVHVIPVQKIRKVPELPAYVLGKTIHEGARGSGDCSSRCGLWCRACRWRWNILQSGLFYVSP